MRGPTLKDLTEATLSFVAYSGVYLITFLLIANLSFYRLDATLIGFGLVVTISFSRFVLRGHRQWVSFIAGVVLSWAWFLIGFDLLDWAVANGPSPAHFSFYISAFESFFKPEYAIVMLVPVSIVVFATLLGYGLAFVVNLLRSMDGKLNPNSYTCEQRCERNGATR